MKVFSSFWGGPTVALALGAVAMLLGRLRRREPVENLGRWLVGIAAVLEIVGTCAFGLWGTDR